MRARDVRDVAWAVGPFQSETVTTASGVRLRNWWTRNIDEQAADRVAADVQEAIETYTADYGRYPYAELDTMVAGFDGFSGMEYPALIFTEPDRVTTVHEVAHQWWYGLVGNDQYNDPWLDESLTHYSTTRVTGVPGYCRAAPFWFSPGMRLDAGMDYYADHRDEYPPAIYGDGACMFHELEQVMGEPNVTRALAAYAVRFSHEVAASDDLRAALQRESVVDLTDFWVRWRNTGP